MAAARPTAAAGAGAGTSPPAPVMDAFAADDGWYITWGTGTTPAAGVQVVVTTSNSWTGYLERARPMLGITPANSATATLNLYIDWAATDLRQVNIGSVNAPTASQGNTVYAAYVTIQG